MVPKPLSLVMMTRDSAAAISMICPSPGSRSHSVTVATSCPSRRSSSARNHERQLSTSSLTETNVSQALPAPSDDHRLDVFIADDMCRVEKAGLNILTLEPWIVLQKVIRRRACRQHFEHMLHRQPAASDDRSPTEDLGVDGDPVEQFPLSHARRFYSRILAPHVRHQRDLRV